MYQLPEKKKHTGMESFMLDTFRIYQLYNQIFEGSIKVIVVLFLFSEPQDT